MAPEYFERLFYALVLGVFFFGISKLCEKVGRVQNENRIGELFYQRWDSDDVVNWITNNIPDVTDTILDKFISHGIIDQYK